MTTFCGNLKRTALLHNKAVLCIKSAVEIKLTQGWDVSPQEAIKIQSDLLSKIVFCGGPEKVKTIAGVDVGFHDNLAQAAVVVLSYPDLNVIEEQIAELPITFPYVPGLLAFREAPVVLATIEKLKTEPDVFIFDAHGYSHPRRMGLATHLGIILQKPSIGCAKSKLCGNYEEPENEVGKWSPLMDRGETIGAVLRTKKDSPPIFVSVGNLIDLASAIKIILSCCLNNRLPKPTLLAHEKVSSSNQTPGRIFLTSPSKNPIILSLATSLPTKSMAKSSISPK